MIFFFINGQCSPLNLSNPYNFLYAFDLFEFFYKVIQVLCIVDIEHYSAFKNPRIAIEMNIADVDIILTGNDIGKVTEKAQVVDTNNFYS